jgi:hypothetical protein
MEKGFVSGDAAGLQIQILSADGERNVGSRTSIGRDNAETLCGQWKSAISGSSNHH